MLTALLSPVGPLLYSKLLGFSRWTLEICVNSIAPNHTNKDVIKFIICVFNCLLARRLWTWKQKFNNWNLGKHFVRWKEKLCISSMRRKSAVWYFLWKSLFEATILTTDTNGFKNGFILKSILFSASVIHRSLQIKSVSEDGVMMTECTKKAYFRANIQMLNSYTYIFMLE